MNRRAMIKTWTTALFHALLLAACSPGQTDQPALQGVDIKGTPIGGPFTLVDKDGKTVRWEDFAGKYRIVYFGYTWCPDACPMDVGVLMQGFNRFAKEHPAQAAKIQPIFISVDPERDTPAKVGEFTAAFSPRLLGLTGTQAQVDEAVKSFKALALKGKQLDNGGYLMDHSRAAYLFDPQGQPIATLPIDKNPEAVAADLAISVT